MPAHRAGAPIPPSSPTKARQRRAVAAGLVTAVLFLTIVGAGLILIWPNLVNRPGGTVTATNNFDQVVVVLMENKNLADVYGPAPYMTQLADQYAFAQHWASLTNPSQPNYIGLIGGSLFGVSGDGNHPNLNHPTIVDIIENSGHTWKAFAEDASGSGCGLRPPRGEDHFPFLSFVTITGNPARCANLQAGSGQAVIDAFNAGTNFIWLTPNDCNNMHSCSVSTGDNYLKGWVPTLLSAMAGKKAALILTFDEGYTNPPYVYTGFSGTAAKTGYKSTASYNHYSLIKLIEDVWGGGNLGQGDVNAPSPVEFFQAGGPDFSISANPTSVSFGAGQSSTSTVRMTASGGFAGTVGLSAASNPSGVSASCVPSSISGGQTSTCTLSSSTPGSYTITVTGTSGSLVHTASIAATVTASGPTARFTHSPVLPKVGETVTFDASSSTDTDASATLQARWDWEGDGQWDTSYSSALTAQHAYSAPGMHTVILEILDSNALTGTASAVVSVLASSGEGIGAPPGYGLTDPAALRAHAPMYINGNAGFTAANGVQSGSGTAADPYVIRDWFIDGTLYPGSQAMIHIENTDAYVVIENNKIVNLANSNHWEAIQLGHWPATINTQHVTIRHNDVENAQHAYGIAVRSGSSDVHVEANFVRTDANYDWVYGIMTDRGVHDVTVSGNYVDAYTSVAFHTAGIHLSDTYVDDASRATGLVATQNTVVNATAAAIESGSSTGTVITGNLVYTDTAGLPSVGAGYPRGIDTAWNSVGTIVFGNLIHTFASGILVGADDDVVASNTIFGVDYGIFVPDNGSIPGVAVFGGTIYNTTMWDVSREAVRLPNAFGGTVVDLGSGIRSTDLTSVLLATDRAASRIAIAWSGLAVNLSATVDGTVFFDTAVATESQNLQATWTGSIAKLNLTALSPHRLAFHLESGAGVLLEGTGFASNGLYHVTRTDPSGTSEVLTVQSSSSGGLSLTVPAAEPSDYVISTDATPGPSPEPGFPSLPTIPGLPGFLQTMPFFLILLGVLPMVVTLLLVRRRRRRRGRSRPPSRKAAPRSSRSRRIDSSSSREAPDALEADDEPDAGDTRLW
ncbi:MAG TPA: alkaline phosphatase family protein [Thermoplasmata archaeon]|nr:alkaline phosphatase family protein [Thermoplasmata archaeon]